MFLVYTNDVVEDSRLFNHAWCTILSHSKTRESFKYVHSRFLPIMNAMHVILIAYRIGKEGWFCIQKHIQSFDISASLWDWNTWCGSISRSTWKEFENVQSYFLMKFFRVNVQNVIDMFLLFETYFLRPNHFTN